MIIPDPKLEQDIAEATSWGEPCELTREVIHKNLCNIIARMRYRISGYEELLDKNGIKYTYSKAEYMRALAKGEDITCIKQVP